MTATTPPLIPFFPPDLFEDDRDLLLDVVHEVATDPAQRFILGDRTARFEDLLRTDLGAADVIACGSGTTALTLILRAMGITAGDEVIVPAFGCAPLANTVLGVGATPVFADIDPHTLVIDPDAAEALITARTKALMPAHMFSVMADMPRMRALADRHGLRLIEDSAVAQGAVLDGRPAGTWGDAGLFSFVQVKSFGGPGEGGVVVTDDPELARTVRMLRNHGQDGTHRFRHHLIGMNSRFDEVLAAFQLRRHPGLARRLARRAEIAAHYTEQFTPLAAHGITPPSPGTNGRCYYVYSLLSEDRDKLKQHLADHGVDSHVYYPRPLPHQPAFALAAPADGHWPNAERAARQCLSIPIYPHLTDPQVDRITEAVLSFAPTPAPVA
ncbi:DegT/DnrJ/EryC1/StrS family aminotransferase [Kitasatospora cheerisanensis]|uniref:Aminotransferase DegT n=1 Tax=Kitasatospora cheerisanensis KCTC 2395 TaxID=1348663 RepID=A0A066Z905_9ACTN|nr:DegT/DnrJ/EryC1/StrS family aminotransferase [Kitasatospora cheerisanensis]KDN86645.1 aminotransferase DegT [Kitasatospora cheerisanensis KCTC 2395]